MSVPWAAMGAAIAAAQQDKAGAMTCTNGHDEVRWVGPEFPCWSCGEQGMPLHPNPKQADIIRQYAGERGE